MNPEPGTISACGDDSLRIGTSFRIKAGGVHLFIAAADAGNLIFNGHAVPISKSACRTGAGGITESVISIEGHAAVSPGGKAVKLFTTTGHFIVPLVSLQRVAKGKAVSAPLFPLEPDLPEERS